MKNHSSAAGVAEKPAVNALINKHCPPKRILVALDPSRASEIAWEEAEILSKIWRSKVEGVYVQPWLWAGNSEFGYADPQLTAKTSEETVERLRRNLGIKERIVSLPGDPVEEITRWAHTNKFDLIVVGTQSRLGLARAFHSSVAEAVVRHSQVPVLIAKRPVKKPEAILAPYDLNSSSVPGLEFAAACAKIMDARLNIFHVAAAPNAEFSGDLSHIKKTILSGLDNLPAPQKPHKIEAQVAWGKPINEILKASLEADLVVLTARSRGFLEDMILGTTAERVIRYSESSVLAVPAVADKGEI
jgi:nucleotide-binding universal stress UspA family protein